MKKVLLFTIVIAAILVGCKKDDKNVKSITATPTSMSVYYDEKSEIKMSYSPDDAPLPTYSYTASDEYVATVDLNGLVSGKHVGECVIDIATDNGISTECTVTVKPRSNLYREPFLTFGGSFTDVKGYEKRTLSSEITDALLYKGENSSIRYIMYLFENGKMTSAIVMLANTSYCVEETHKYLIERYDAMGVSNSIIFYNGKGRTIGFSLDDDLGLIALYIPDTKAKSYDVSQINKIKEAFSSLLQK